MKRFYQLILVLGIALLMLPSTSKATHVMGSDITWDCLGNDSFEVTLTVYRDCTGVTLRKPSLNVGCDSGASSAGAQVTETSYNNGEDITPICDASRSQCSGGGSYSYGIEKHEVTYIVDLSNSNCCKVNFNYSECCRSNSITTGLSGDQYYAESWFDRCKAPCNSSPDFSEQPTDILCVNRKQVYTQGAVDTDTDSTGKLLDSLRYTFGNPLGTGPNDQLNYNSPYSKNIPLDYKGTRPDLPFVPRGYGFHLDNQTGDLRFTPTSVQVSVMSVKVSEYREVNGKKQLIGETRRDVQFFVKNCTQNKTPTITGMDCPSNISFKQVCEGEQVRTDFCTNDADPKDSVKISFKPGNLPGAPSFTVKNPKAQYQDGELTWTPADGDASPIAYRFSVTAKDDNCPEAGSATRTYQIRVKPTPKAEITKTNKLCGTYEFSARPIKGAGLSYQWRSSSSDLKSNSQTFQHTFEEPGKYPYRLKVTARGCSRTYYDTVTLDPFLRVDIGNDTTICKNGTVNLGGKAKDNNGPVSYTWHDSVTGKQNRTFSNLQQDTTISLTVEDTVCSYTDVVKIDVRERPELDLGTDPRICADDTATIAPRLLTSPDSMKNPPWIYLDDGLQVANYKWYRGSTTSAVIGETDTIELTTQGNYILEASDTFNCAATDTLTLNTNPELDPNAFPPRICRGDTSNLRAEKTGGATTSYTWTNLRTNKTYTGRQINVSPDSTTEFALVVEETTKGVFCKDSATTAVEVKDLPNVAIDGQADICTNENRIDLNDTLNPNQSAFSGVWKSEDLPGGALNGSFIEPDRVSQGQYTVKFEWTEPRGTPSPRCTNIDSAEVFIRPTPTVDAGTDSILCTHDDPLKLEGSPAAPAGDWKGVGVSNANNQADLSYDPSDDQVPSNQTNSLFYVYSEPTYGCTTEDTVQITVQQSPTPDFGDKELCITQKTLNLRNIANKGEWLGNEVADGDFNTPDQPGSYEARYEVSSRDFRTCTVQDTIAIQVKDTVAVKAATQSGNTAFCETLTSVQLAGQPAGGTGEWKSIGGTALIENGNVLNPASSNLGDNRLEYKYTDPSTGCVNRDTFTVQVDPEPEVSILETDTSKCRGASYGVAAEYDNVSRIPTWQAVGRGDLTGFSDISSRDQVISANYSPSDKQEDSGAFTVTIEAQNDGECPNVFDSAAITTKPVPEPDFSADNAGCPPFDVAFDNKTTITEGGTITGYEWKLGNGQQSEAETPETTYDDPGRYTVSLRAFSAEGCEATRTKEDFIQVSEKPEIDFSADPTLTTINASRVEFTNLTEGENTPLSYKWFFGEESRRGAESTSRTEEPVYNYADTGTYDIRLSVTNSKGCTDTLVRDDYVRIRPTVISYAPSAFSPNDDGKNDVYRVEAQYFTDFGIQIFNRWGEQVYSSDNYETHGWDGTFEGEQAPLGVYTYVIKATGMDGEDYTFSGTVTLIR